MPWNVPYIDRIWRVKSSLDLDKPLSADEAFERLNPLFQTQGTNYSQDGDTLTYSKKNPAAQDKLATFTAGTLRLTKGESTSRLDYDVTSTALLLCFLAPFFFLGFAGLTLVINELEAPFIAAEKAEEEKRKAEEGEEEEEEEKIELHWIDRMLGAPEPKQPGEEEDEDKDRNAARDGEEAREGREGEEEEEEDDANHSPNRSLVLAGIFFAIFCVGRVLEPYLLKRTFKRALMGDPDVSEADLGIEA